MRIFSTVRQWIFGGASPPATARAAQSASTDEADPAPLPTPVLPDRDPIHGSGIELAPATEPAPSAGSAGPTGRTLRHRFWDGLRWAGGKIAMPLQASYRGLASGVALLNRKMTGSSRIALSYFDDVLAIERAEINLRRARARIGGAAREPVVPISARDAPAMPDAGTPKVIADRDTACSDLDEKRTRPQPRPCTATGLALSGGGIRSAAVCLGAVQALAADRRLDTIDYISSVSGGGYTAACLSASMSATAPQPHRDGNAQSSAVPQSPALSRHYPFGVDVADNAAIAHLRNYSNYLLPRGRSAVENLSEAGAVLSRGLVANSLFILRALVGCALLTVFAFRQPEELAQHSFLIGVATHTPILSKYVDPNWQGRFGATIGLLAALGVVLVGWAMTRARKPGSSVASDTAGPLLTAARYLLLLSILSLFLDLQALALADRLSWMDYFGHALSGITLTGLAGFAGTVAIFGGRLARFLEASDRGGGTSLAIRRWLTQLMIVVAALVVPVLLWLAYLNLAMIVIFDQQVPRWISFFALDWLPQLNTWVAAHMGGFALPIMQVGRVLQVAGSRLGLTGHSSAVTAYWTILIATTAVAINLNGNSYSLNRFYRDRLSRAFLFRRGSMTAAASPPSDIKLSELQGGDAPYPIINAALNVQGSAAANRRGRNADFFTFTPHFVGSDLTFYARTKAVGDDCNDMETEDPRLNLATAMAVSGAALSANMGGSTIGILSPTLALLNIRLGYWLVNPGHKQRTNILRLLFTRFTGLVLPRPYLLPEMLNMLTERMPEIYLSDGGHIENLGLYQLLKRGCRLIVVVDAEADPTMSFPSLLRVERYARIDLGVRLTIPWEQIARYTATASAAINAKLPCTAGGPHCAIGRIDYADGAEGMLVYFKSSLTGDEKDYVRDYKIRNPAFPHEPTGDQFFSEEQFEMYRALGFHMVSGVFGGDDAISFIDGPGDYAGKRALLDRLNEYLPQADAA